MLSRDLEKLDPGTYVLVDMDGSGDLEPVRFRAIRGPNERELRYGSVTNRVEIRRFLVGGWVDSWVYPRDVKGVAEPSAGLLRMISYIEENVGEKPKPR